MSSRGGSLTSSGLSRMSSGNRSRVRGVRCSDEKIKTSNPIAAILAGISRTSSCPASGRRVEGVRSLDLGSQACKGFKL